MVRVLDVHLTDRHVIAILGSEDYFGYSFGWGGDQKALGATGFTGTQHSGTTLWEQAKDHVALATYTFFPAPIRFTERIWAQVNWRYVLFYPPAQFCANWRYDTGHNVPGTRYLPFRPFFGAMGGNRRCVLDRRYAGTA